MDPRPTDLPELIRSLRTVGRDSLLRAIAGVSNGLGDRAHGAVRRSDGASMTVSLHMLGRLALLTAIHGQTNARPATRDDVINLCSLTHELKEPIPHEPTLTDVRAMLVRMSWDQMPYQHSPYFDFDVWLGFFTRTSGPSADFLREHWSRTFRCAPREWYLGAKTLWVISMLTNQFSRGELLTRLGKIEAARDLLIPVMQDLTIDIVELETKYASLPIAPGFEKYAHNPLATYPILEYSRSRFVMPTPRHFGNAIGMATLYRMSELRSDNLVFDSFGSVFEQYIGILLRSIFTEVYPETRYRVQGQSWDGLDWVVNTEHFCLLIECRSGRVPQGIRSEADFNELLDVLSDKYGKTMNRFETKIGHIAKGFTQIPPEVIDKPIVKMVVTSERLELEGMYGELLGHNPAEWGSVVLVDMHAFARILATVPDQLYELVEEWRASYVPLKSGSFTSWLFGDDGPVKPSDLRLPPPLIEDSRLMTAFLEQARDAAGEA